MEKFRKWQVKKSTVSKTLLIKFTLCHWKSDSNTLVIQWQSIIHKAIDIYYSSFSLKRTQNNREIGFQKSNIYVEIISSFPLITTLRTTLIFPR